jgi:hypothetical protein
MGVAMWKIVAGVVSGLVLLAALRFLGAPPSLQSPTLLAELCGLGAIVALIVSLLGPDKHRREDDAELGLSARAARRPRWPSM